MQTGLHARGRRSIRPTPKDSAIVAACALLAQEAARWHVRAALAMVDAGSLDTTEHDGLGRADELTVTDAGDMWELVDLPGGPPTQEEVDRLIVGSSGAWRVRGHAICQALVPSTGAIALVCRRCACASLKKVRGGGFATACGGPEAEGLRSNRGKLKRM